MEWIEVMVWHDREFGIMLHSRAVSVNHVEFVTHEFRVDSPNDFYWGHYFDTDIRKARMDFMERVKGIIGE